MGVHRDARAAQAAGRGIDHHVEGIVHFVQTARGEIDPPLAGEGRVSLDQAGCLGTGAIGHHDAARPRFDERAQDAGRSASGADQQQVPARQVHTSVARDVIDQADAVGVVGGDFRAVELQHVAGLRQPRSGGEVRGQRRRLELERHGDVAAPAALGAKGRDGAREAVQRDQPLVVAQVLAGEFGEAGVDPR
jgi:hypothetical protein